MRLRRVTIQPGDTVRWVWDGFGHTVTSANPDTGLANGLFNSGLRNTGYVFSYTFQNSGSYFYFCDPHKTMGMNGTITVGTPPSLPSQALNISTRLSVQTGDNVLIGGFIITGTQPKKVIVRAIGPSLPLAGKLENPTMELVGPNGSIASNDNWMDAPNKQEIIDSTVPPENDLESAIVATLPSNRTGYTAIVRGVNDGTGIGLVEVYDLDPAVDSKLANISSRGLVQTGDNVMIGGFILGKNGGPAKVIVRAIGPSLSAANISGALADPTVELRDGNGVLVRGNDNWKETQQAEIEASGIPPSDNLESAVLATLAPGPYTAIVGGKNGTSGVALVELYQLD